MVKHFATAILAAAIALPALAGNKDVAAIHAVDQAFGKAFAAQDANALAALYAEDAVFMPPNEPAVVGRAAIRDYFAKMSSAMAKDGLSLNLDGKPSGGASGNLGWSSASYTLTSKDGKVIDKGKALSVSVKKNGKWLYVRDTYNSDMPPAPAK